jgi:hypothetical protein
MQKDVRGKGPDPMNAMFVGVVTDIVLVLAAGR